MPKVNTEMSVRMKRCGFRIVPGQNSSCTSGRSALQLAEELACCRT